MRAISLSFGLYSYLLLCTSSINAMAQVDTPTAKPPVDTTFEQMLIDVYQHNPKLESQRQELKILDEKLSQAHSGYRPSLSANAAYGRQRLKVAQGNWQYGKDVSKSLVATQPIFNGFGTQAQADAAKERVHAGRAKLLSEEQNVFFSAIAAWLDICEKDRVLSLTRDNRDRIAQYYDATRERYKAGDGTTTDIALSESRLADADAKLAKAEAERDIAIASYERVTDLKPAVGDFPAVPQELPLSDQEVQSLVNHNPDLQRASHLQNAAEHDIDTARSSLWPTVSLKGAMDEERSTAFGLNQLRDDSMTVNVSIPLYQGGAEYSRIREAKLMREKSRMDRLDITRDVTQQSKSAWSNFMASIKIIQAAKRIEKSAKEALEGISEEHLQGTRTLTEVLDAQSELLNAQITQTRAQKDSRLEAYRLMASVGKLTIEGLHLSTDPYDPTVHFDDVKWQWAGTAIDKTAQADEPPYSHEHPAEMLDGQIVSAHAP